VREVMPNVISAGGYSGHGVMLSNFFGKLAETVAGNRDRLKLIEDLKIPSFPGGGVSVRHCSSLRSTGLRCETGFSDITDTKGALMPQSRVKNARYGRIEGPSAGLPASLIPMPIGRRLARLSKEHRSAHQVQSERAL
jgi:hypothetical protein